MEIVFRVFRKDLDKVESIIFMQEYDEYPVVDSIKLDIIDRDYCVRYHISELLTRHMSKKYVFVANS